MEYSIGKKISSQLKKIVLNEYGDSIQLNIGDATFSRRFSNLIKWIDEKNNELSRIADEMSEKYKDSPMIKHSEENGTEIDSEQFEIYIKLKTDLYEECAGKIDAMFGQDTIRKYFRAFYEINPEFIPDEECIMDFLEEITPVLEAIYEERFEKIKKRYSKSRRGASKKASGNA